MVLLNTPESPWVCDGKRAAAFLITVYAIHNLAGSASGDGGGDGGGGSAVFCGWDEFSTEPARHFFKEARAFIIYFWARAFPQSGSSRLGSCPGVLLTSYREPSATTH